MVTPEVVGLIDPVCFVEQTDVAPGTRRAGLVGAADRDPRIPAYAISFADLEAEGVATEGRDASSSCQKKVD
jgi:hypothetical protein